MEQEALTHEIIGLAMKIHRKLGPGFLESVYHNALAHELGKAGLEHHSQHHIDVIYDEVRVGQFIADFFIEDRVLVELKAILDLTSTHEAQLVNYLTATHVEIGLLLNFGSSSLQFKRKHRTYRPPKDPSIP